MITCRICKKREAELLIDTKEVYQECYDMLIRKKLNKKEKKNLKIFKNDILLE
ncbi:MAG: hypothetical protein ACP5D2_00350 [Candidatus Nanoarchaeia archaeon]